MAVVLPPLHEIDRWSHEWMAYDQAMNLMRSLGIQQKLIETIDLQARLEQLEEMIKGLKS